MRRRTVSSDYARRVGDELGIDWSRVSREEFQMGVETELEHFATIRRIAPGWSFKKMGVAAGMIALDHLLEIGDYYTRLARMEAEAMRGELHEQGSLCYLRAGG